MNVAIVGAGPAGIAAADVLTAHGLAVAVIDEGREAGGQVYRRARSELKLDIDALMGAEAANYRDFHAAFDRLRGRIEYRPETLAWGIEEKRLHTLRAGVADTVAFDALILATGATDRVLPIPGWTLPGAFTLGGAQVLLKEHRVRRDHAPEADRIAPGGQLQLQSDAGLSGVARGPSSMSRERASLAGAPALLVDGSCERRGTRPMRTVLALFTALVTVSAAQAANPPDIAQKTQVVGKLPVNLSGAWFLYAQAEFPGGKTRALAPELLSASHKDGDVALKLLDVQLPKSIYEPYQAANRATKAWEPSPEDIALLR
jgi:hypothetical protein